jgi:5-bromo-4-chloroindolyl phosphate hydrolysis protein
MAKNDWYEAGEEIKNLVQDAVETQDFSQLSATITSVMNRTMDGFQEALKDSLSGKAADAERGNTAAGGEPGSGHRTDSNDDKDQDVQKTYHEAADRIRRRMEQRQTDTGKSKSALPVKQKAPGKIAGTVMACTGYGLGGICGLTLAMLGVIGAATGVSMAVPCGILGILTAGSLWLGVSGSRKIGLAGRFKRYVGCLRERTYCTIEELASGTGKSVGYVRKDLKRMIQKGFFPEGHLDRQETCLMTDHETYQQYLIAQQGYDRRTEAEKAEAQAEKNRRDAEQNRNDAGSRENLSSECRALLEEGKRYIRHIHECNDRIPGQEISEKLDRLEQVVTRIFNEVERRPELAPELRKMMSYYLPTTQKLLDAYCEMDAQQIQGQNIDMTKREIEDALDTINKAFENLLDGFFEHTAWDISSDISVLHTMFAQEGLTGQEFRQEK